MAPAFSRCAADAAAECSDAGCSLPRRPAQTWGSWRRARTRLSGRSGPLAGTMRLGPASSRVEKQRNITMGVERPVVSPALPHHLRIADFDLELRLQPDHAAAG